MQVTSKGQVTIPQDIRNRLGLLPHTKVAFEFAGDHARIRKAGREGGESPEDAWRSKLCAAQRDLRMTTDEIMALTRGGAHPRKRRK